MYICQPNLPIPARPWYLWLSSHPHIHSLLSASFKDTFKDPCDSTGSTWIIQDNLPVSSRLISNLNAPLLWDQHIPSSRWRGHGYLWQAIICLIHSLINNSCSTQQRQWSFSKRKYVHVTSCVKHFDGPHSSKDKVQTLNMCHKATHGLFLPTCWP